MIRCLPIIILFLLAFNTIKSQGSFATDISEAKAISSDRHEQIRALEKILIKRKYSTHHDSLGLVQYAIAYRYRILGQDFDVIDISTKATQNFRKSNYQGYQHSFTLSFLGESYSAIGQVDSALVYYQNIIERVPVGRDLSIYGYAGFQAASIFMRHEDYNSALDIIQYILTSTYVDELTGIDKVDLRLAWANSLVQIDSDQNLKEAQSQLDIAKTIMSALPDEDQFQRLELDIQQAAILLYSGKNNEASQLYDKIVQNMLAINDEFEAANAEAAAMAGNASFSFQVSKDFNRAISYAKKAASIFSNYGNEKYRSIEYYIYSNLATSYLGDDQLDSSFYYLNKGLSLFEKSTRNEDPDKGFILELLYNKAKTHFTTSVKNNDPKQLRLGLSTIQELDTLFDFHIDEQLSTYSVQNIRSKGTEYYKLGIDIAFALNDVAAYWQFSEKMKGLQLLTANLANQANDHSKEGIHLNKIKRSILELNYLVNKSEISTKTDSLQALLSIARRERLEALQRLKNSKEKGQTSISTISDVQASIHDQVMIQYQAGSHDMYGLSISNNDLSLNNLGPINQYITAIPAIRKLVQDPDSRLDSIAWLSKILYKKLIQPFDNVTRDLIIIPDEALSFLPFDILKNDKDSYLLENTTISYAISGSFHLSNFENITGFRTISLVQPKYEVNSNFPPLPYAEEEAIRIGTSYKIPRAKNRPYAKSKIDSTFRKAGVFHFSGHAIADVESGEMSFLALGSDDTLEDKLMLGELYTLSTQAQMVVLSACNTGVGQILKGEGVESLTRGFFFAGAQSVINTLWTVDDKSTSIIIGDFYDKLSQGQNKSSALQNAKLNYLQSSEAYLQHPYYWSGIVAVGDMSPLKEYKINWTKHFFLLLLFIALGWFLTWRYSRKPMPKIEFLTDVWD